MRFVRSFALAMFSIAGLAAAEDSKMLRFPDIQGDRVVFTSGGDLWSAPVTGGQAKRLTAHPGLELFAKFSPDGKWLAFTGQYDGDEQVYVMPADGGEPKQLTWYPAKGPLPPRWGYDNQVYGWSHDGHSVLYRSMRDGWDLTDTQLYLVGLDGGMPKALEMPVSGGGDLSPDESKVVYSPLTRDFRTWKRYEGGWAQDLYIFDRKSAALTPVAHSVRTERDPMWLGDRIVFASDRDGTLNLYGFDIRSQAVEQLTHEKTWDVRWPSDDEQGRVVYELGGELYVYDLAAKSSRRIPIQVPDDGLWRRPSRIEVGGDVEDFELAPGGERALFVARGDVFTVPIEKGPTRNLTKSSRYHERAARWSPDGKTIAFISDRTGEDELWLIDQAGKEPARQLTKGHQGMFRAPSWSPDSTRLAWSDKDARLRVVEIATGKEVEVAQDTRGYLGDFSWAPDGGYLAFALSEPSNFRAIWVWSVKDGSLHRASDGVFRASSPTWDPKGDYLYYLADTEHAPMISAFEWNFAVDRETRAYALALRRDVKHPFAPQSDEVGGKKDDDKDGAEKDEPAKSDKKDGKADKDKKASKKPIAIDFDGLAERIAEIPIEADNYDYAVAVEGKLILFRGTPFFYGRDSGQTSEIKLYDFEKRKLQTMLEDAGPFAVSSDGKKFLATKDGGYKLYDVQPDAKDGKKVSTAGLEVDRVPAEEWAEVFDEVWRRFRDFFYSANMHGYDWEALGARYRALLPQARHRSDVNTIIGEMIAELNVSHAYIAGGDYEVPRRARVALPGIRFAADAAAQRYRIAHIYGGRNEVERYRVPAKEIGVDLHEGDYVLAIDDEELTTADDPHRHLRNKADRPVTLLVNSKPEKAGARTVTFQPRSSESDLRYFDWVARNRERVSQLSGGKLGYIHIPDMGDDGLREFITWFYPQIKKQGMVIDVRNNGGGNVSSMLLERLRRELLAVSFNRTEVGGEPYPHEVFHGHLVCLLNEGSASDGDIFPAMFREAGLGPLIGKRSWGGVVGITSHGPLIDGGSVNVPQFGHASPQGEWVIEGTGVKPDIVVENDPASILAGRDPQLEKGVEVLLEKIAKEPKLYPQRPADPVKLGGSDLSKK